MTYVASEKKNIFERDEISFKELVAILRVVDEVLKEIWKEEFVELIDYQGKKLTLKKFNLENDLVKNLVNIDIEKIRELRVVPNEGIIKYIVDIYYGRYIIVITIYPDKYGRIYVNIGVYDQETEKIIAGRVIDQIDINWSEINK
jgi:hypothetical protein